MKSFIEAESIAKRYKFKNIFFVILTFLSLSVFLHSYLLLSTSVKASGIPVQKAIYAWGANAWGQLGDGTTTDRNSPVAVSGLTGGVSKIATIGWNASLALKADGTVWSWGENNFGQLGQGTIDSSAHSTPTQISGLSKIVDIVGGDAFALALGADGTVWSWGDGYNGELGRNSSSWASCGTNRSCLSTPGQVQLYNSSTLSNIKSIAASEEAGFALRSDGKVLTFGLGTFGETGENCNTTYQANYVYTNSSGTQLSNIVEIDASGLTPFAVDGGGNQWTWAGSAGNCVAVQVSSLSYVVKSSANPTSNYDAHALEADGSLWNINTSNDSATSNSTFTSGVSDISGGANNSGSNYYGVAFVIKNDGTVYAWGDNTYGQLGNGSTGGGSMTPTQISSLSHVSSMSSKAAWALALTY